LAKAVSALCDMARSPGKKISAQPIRFLAILPML
jgi:hypothetical protein